MNEQAPNQTPNPQAQTLMEAARDKLRNSTERFQSVRASLKERFGDGASVELPTPVEAVDPISPLQERAQKIFDLSSKAVGNAKEKGQAVKEKATPVVKSAKETAKSAINTGKDAQKEVISYFSDEEEGTRRMVVAGAAGVAVVAGVYGVYRHRKNKAEVAASATAKARKPSRHAAKPSPKASTTTTKPAQSKPASDVKYYEGSKFYKPELNKDGEVTELEDEDFAKLSIDQKIAHEKIMGEQYARTRGPVYKFSQEAPEPVADPNAVPSRRQEAIDRAQKRYGKSAETVKQQRSRLGKVVGKIATRLEGPAPAPKS